MQSVENESLEFSIFNHVCTHHRTNWLTFFTLVKCKMDDFVATEDPCCRACVKQRGLIIEEMHFVRKLPMKCRLFQHYNNVMECHKSPFCIPQ
jgi:hypothetical protein